MKKIISALALLLALSSFAFAGQDGNGSKDILTDQEIQLCELMSEARSDDFEFLIKVKDETQFRTKNQFKERCCRHLPHTCDPKDRK